MLKWRDRAVYVGGKDWGFSAAREHTLLSVGWTLPKKTSGLDLGKKLVGWSFLYKKKNITAFFRCDVSVTALICLYLFSYLLANALF